MRALTNKREYILPRTYTPDLSSLVAHTKRWRLTKHGILMALRNHISTHSSGDVEPLCNACIEIAARLKDAK